MTTPSGITDTTASAYAQWLAYIQQQQRAQQQPAVPDDAGLGSADSVTISQQSLVILELNQVSAASGSPTGAASSALAQIGASIQQQNPMLFKALDTNGDGSLDGDELKAGRQTLQDAIRLATQQVGGASAGSGADAGVDPAQRFLNAVESNLQQSDPALAKAISGSDGTLTARGLQQATQALHLHHRHHHGGGGQAQQATAPSPATGGDGGASAGNPDIQLQTLGDILSSLSSTTPPG